ncbi:hypothetical protein NNJEOMEG_01731 [Fundidesulfovibrio magnetotacticus]|uniref:AAA+ ATPase domain-containing protein n=1 Tax=Fundidesulfovibrio magnetotacticus TaxID=2730080 RepID=A0A6V8LMJ5_9BACT|nr:XrtA/PEP-CTERM system-associated ATPase [Fundidesulfovibrio magnetotacticus]GFK93893.1 hypothetical protein NNJEOMEG_01731 [Fundidesulfovibrio magnetotacticus]
MNRSPGSPGGRDSNVYGAFFGFDRKPFELVPNPSMLFMSAGHKKAFNYLSYGIRQQSGFILLTGEVGAGKTTLVRGLIKSQLSDVVLAKVFNTKVHARQLLEMILEDFGVHPAGKDKPSLLRDLNDFLIEQYSRGRQCVLIVDEAQNLNRELLEEVRLLSNLESDSQKLLRIILVGQPELKQLLASPELLQLRQRIQVSCHIHPLQPTEVGHYIGHRLEAAGNKNAADFKPGSLEAIGTYTRGVPRLINILCDYLFLDAFANETREITAEAVHEVAKDLDFDNQYWNHPTVPPALEEPQQRQHAHLASAKMTSLLKNLNGRLRSIEEALPRLEQASQPVPPPDMSDVLGKLSGLQETLNSRLDEMWNAVGRLSREVHDISERMEPSAVCAPLPSPEDTARREHEREDLTPLEAPLVQPPHPAEHPRLALDDNAPRPAKGGWMRRFLLKAS